MKKTLAVILVLMISITSSIYPYYEARAAGLPELIYTSLPLTWPLVTKIFQALGVGTAEYFNSLPLGDREDLVLGVHDYLSPVVAGIFEMMGVRSSNDNLDDYIPGVIDDGIMRVPKAVFDAASQFAKDNGMLNSGNNDILVQQDSIFVNGQNIDISDSVNSVQALANVLLKVYANSSRLDKLENGVNFMLSNYSTGYYVRYYHDSASSGNDMIYAIPYENIKKNVCNTAFLSTSTNYYRYSVLVNGFLTYITSNSTSTVAGTENFLLQMRRAEVGSASGTDYTSLGLGIEAGSNVPVGEKGQTSEQDGAWDLPYSDGSSKNIDNVGDTYPLSIPNSVGDALIKWAEHAGDIDIALPDVIDPELTKPVEGDQTVAQEGTVSDPPAIDPESPLLPNVPALTVPNFIKERFPFCIPFEIAEIARRFQGAGVTAPVIDYNIPIAGSTCHLYFDFSVMNDLAQVVRMGILILTAIGVMKMTGDMIKW